MRRERTWRPLTWRMWIGLLLLGALAAIDCRRAEADAFIRTQITDTLGGVNSQSAFDAAGIRIVFVSDRDLTPGNPGNADGNTEIFLYNTFTRVFTQITNTVGGSMNSPSINADGTRIAFISNRDLTPGNPGNADGNSELFLFDTTSGLFTQITNTVGGLNAQPSINATGTRIAFTSDRNLTPGLPGNVDGNTELFLFDTTSGQFIQITNTTGGLNALPAINAAGTRIAFTSNRDLTPGSPGNADGNTEIFLFDTTTAHFTQITSSTGGFNTQPTINASGTRIAFSSDRDLTPFRNSDRSGEIFLFDTATGVLTQITDNIGGLNSAPSINADGTRIAFLSNVNFTSAQPGNPDHSPEVFLIDTTTALLTQITNTSAASPIAVVFSSISINAAGTRIAFASNRDVAPGNPGNADANFEIFLASHRSVLGDFDGDLKKDLAVYRPTTGEWFVFGTVTGFQAYLFGAGGDIPVPADYDGDGKADLAVYRPATGEWFIFGTATGFQSRLFGAPASSGLGDRPVPADFDGDGKADLAVYRQATGEWLIFGTATGFQTRSFGAPASSGLGDTPVPADFDGDGKADLAVYRQASGEWLVFGTATGFQSRLFGAPASSGLGDRPVPADFDGDGKADLAIYRQSTGGWLVLGSTTGFQQNQFGGGPSDIPVPGDYDADGKADLAIYRRSTGEWFVLRSLDGLTQTAVFGAPGDVPVP